MIIIKIQRDAKRFELIELFHVLRELNTQAQRLENEATLLGIGIIITKRGLFLYPISHRTLYFSLN
jgi:hypothetical protein